MNTALQKGERRGYTGLDSTGWTGWMDCIDNYENERRAGHIHEHHRGYYRRFGRWLRCADARRRWRYHIQLI